MEAMTMSGSPPSVEPEPASEPVPETILAGIEAHLAAREAMREKLHDEARTLRRAAQRAMTALHAGRITPAALTAVRTDLDRLVHAARAADPHDMSVIDPAIQEAVEALLLGRVMDGGPWPGPAELGVDPEPYVYALGDLVGEVRRLTLQALSRGDLARAETDLALMEALQGALFRLEAPRSVLTLKPKQDTARALVERTRGEITVARLLAQARLPPQLGGSG
jgi:translin